MSRERYSLSIALFVLLQKGREICMLKREGQDGWVLQPTHRWFRTGINSFYGTSSRAEKRNWSDRES